MIKDPILRSFPELYERINSWVTLAKLTNKKCTTSEHKTSETITLHSDLGYIEIQIKNNYEIKIEILCDNILDNINLDFDVRTKFLEKHLDLIEEYVKML